jgi:hypothetical protein
MLRTADTVEPCPSKDQGTEMVGVVAGIAADPGATARHVATDSTARSLRPMARQADA